MTWVIATSGPFGYATGVADVQVTWKNGTTRDCVQKIHRVSTSLALGFAGSVRIGFDMCRALTSLLNVPPPPDGRDWDPAWVAEKWQSDASKVFAAADLRERESGCHLLLLGAHPNKDIGGSEWPLTQVFRMQSPDFKPEAFGIGVASIGSGNSVASYTAKIAEIVADETRFPYFQAQGLGPFGYGEAVISTIERAIQDEPTRGISPHLHLAVVTRRFVGIRPNDYTVLSTPPREFRMPRVATTWEEFQQLVGYAQAAEAIC